MRLARPLVLLSLVALLIAAPAAAQNVSSHLTGTAKDAKGGVLPGVTVTATSPALIGSQIQVTGANGSYLFPSLPAGTYTLKFELPGFQTFTRTGITLSLGQTLTVNAELAIASLKENVTVTAESPVVDTQTTTLGNTLNTAKLISVPTSTDLWGALAQSAGVRMESFDVGGSHKYQQGGYSAFGEQGQSRVITEGVDTTEGTSGAGFYQDYYSQSEIAVSAAGQDVSMNTPGAAVISTIKSGGNTFKSLLNQSYEPSSFVGDNVDSSITARGGSAAKNLLFWESHADLGGPIKKDNLWFFAAFNHFHIDQLLPGVPKSVATNLGYFNNFTTKESWKPTSKDTMIGYYQWGRKAEPTRGLSALRPLSSTLAEYATSWMYNGKWERVWTNRFFTELNVGEFGYDFPETPSVDPKTNPPIHDLATGADSGAGFAQGGTYGPFLSHPAKPQVFGDATYYLPTKSAGSHDLKVGMEWMNEMWTFANIGTSGPILWLDNNGQPDEIRLTDIGDPSTLGSAWTPQLDGNKKMALYGQDRWTANSHLTVTAGLRYDRQQPYYRAAKRDPILTDFFSSSSLPGKVLLTRNLLAPRIGVAFDPGGNGQTAIKAFYGRYYYNFSSNFSYVDPAGANSKTYTYTGQAGITDQNYILAHIGKLVGATGGVSTTYNPNLKNPYTDEIDLSAQRQFWGESSIRLAYVRKMDRDQVDFDLIDPQAWNDQFTVPLVVPVSIQSITGGTQSVQNLTVYDIPSSLANAANYTIDNMPASTNNGAQNFDTIEVAFNKRFPKGLFLDTSYDWTRSNALRSPYDASRSNTTQGDPIGQGFFANPYPTVSNRQVTTGWVYHLSANYQFAHQIGIGANFLVQSGWNYARIIGVNLPNAGFQEFWYGNLKDNRSQTVPLLNLRVDKGFNIPHGHSFQVMLDLFNITNANPVTNFSFLNGSKYDQVISMLSPRTMELGLRFEF